MGGRQPGLSYGSTATNHVEPNMLLKVGCDSTEYFRQSRKMRIMFDGPRVPRSVEVLKNGEHVRLLSLDHHPFEGH